MFYDFNRHKRAAEPARSMPTRQPFYSALPRRRAQTPQKIKVLVLILVITLTGLGFLSLLVSGITGRSFL